MTFPFPIMPPTKLLYVGDGADFDGSNDYALRGADLTSNNDSKLGIFSGWLNVQPASPADLKIYSSTGGNNVIACDGGNVGQIIVNFSNTGNTPIMSIKTNSTAFKSMGTSYKHVLASWDLATTTVHMYVDDVSDLNATKVVTNDTIDYTRSEHAIGSRDNTGQKWNGFLFDVYINLGEYLDFSSTANRRKFIDGAGKPVDLGADGSTPTGNPPDMFLHLNDGETANNFVTNAGSGGGFTLTGALITASTSPTD